MENNETKSNGPVEGGPDDPDMLTLYCCDHYWFYVETRYYWKYGPMPSYSTTNPAPALNPGQVAYYQTPNWFVLDEDPRPPIEPPTEPAQPN